MWLLRIPPQHLHHSADGPLPFSILSQQRQVVPRSALLVLRLPGDETFIPAYLATSSWEYSQRGWLSFSGSLGCIMLIEHLAPFAGELLGLLCCYVPSIFSSSRTCVLRARCEVSVLQVKLFESRVNPSVRRSSPACIAAENSALRGQRLR